MTVAVVLLGSLAPAGPPVPPGAVQQAAGQVQEQPRFRTGTTLVEVDAIVRDAQGRFVPDLTPDDFEVLEDGVPQTIEGFYVVTGGRIRGTQPAVTPPLPPLEPSPPAAPSVQRVFVLFFDQEHMAPGGFDRARTAAESLVSNDMQPGDVGGIVSGGAMINDRLTSSLVELQAALRTLKPRDDSRSRQLEMRTWPRFLSEYEVWRVNYGDKETLGQVVARACNDRPDECTHGAPVEETVQQKADMLVPELRAAGMRTIRTLAGLATGLARLPGRKTVVLLSDGFFAEDSWSNLKELTGLAARASVRVYALDTRGLNRGSASSDIIDMPPHGAVSPAGDATLFDTNADAPNSLAVDTGGLMIRNENNFAEALHEIADDTSSYYLLGYRPTNGRFDGSFRQIAVRVKRPGLTVRARRGYMATQDLVASLPTSGGAAPAPAAPATSAEGFSPAPARSQASAAAPQPTSGAEPSPQPAAQPSPEAPGTAPAATPAPTDTAGAAVRLRPGPAEGVSRLENLAGGAGTTAGGKAGTDLPADVEREAREGWEAYQRGDVEAAKTALSAAAASPAAPPWVHYALGWSQFALTEYPAASASWERVRKAVPEFEAVYFDLADGYLQQREFGKAIAVLRDAERRWTADVEVLNALGVVQTARGAVNDAIDSFERAVALEPDDATSCFNLAKTYEMRYAQAQAFRRMQSSNPYLRDRDRAIEYYQRVVQLGGSLRDSAEAGLKRLEK